MTTTTAQPTQPPAVKAYLRRVRSHLPMRQASDILLELESNILDRVEDLAERERREPDAALFERALAELGTPEDVAGAYVEERFLIGPKIYKTFLFYTSLLFVLHMTLVGIATALGNPVQLVVIEIPPVVGGVPDLIQIVAHAVLLDVGFSVLLFSVAPVFRRNIGMSSLEVQAAPRQAASRAVLAGLVIVLLTFFREQLLVVVVGDIAHPLFTPHFEQVLPLMTWVLVFAMIKDLLYLGLGECRLTLAVDATHGAAGVALLLHLLSHEALLALPTAEVFAHFYEPVNAFLSQVANLVIATGIVLLAIKTVRRLVRFAQI